MADNYKVERSNLHNVRDQITRYLDDIDGRIRNLEASGGGITAAYLWSTLLSGIPTDGHIATDNTDFYSVTELRISKYSSDGNDLTPVIQPLNIGSLIGIFEVEDPAATGLFKLDTDPLLVGDYYTMDVTPEPYTGQALPASQDSACNVSFVASVTDIYHDDLLDVTPDQHHPQLHNLGSHTDVNLEDNELKQGQGIFLDALGNWQNRAPLNETFPTGLADGGELNIGPGVNDIEVIAGVGVVVDSYTTPIAPPAVKGVTWSQFNTPITAAPATAGSVVWFSIAATGVPAVPPDIGGVQMYVGELKQYAQGPAPSLSKQEIFLGVAIHNGDTWNEISNPKVINAAAETLREVLTSVLPLSHIIQGGATHSQSTYEVRQDAGTVWENNRNWHVDKSDPNREALPASDPVQFKYVNRDFSDVEPLTSTFDPDRYDDGTGGPVNMPGGGNTASIQMLFLDPANNYWCLWGQSSYPNFFTAEANLATNLANSTIPFILQNSILIGYAVMEKGKNDWDVNEAVWIPASAAGVGGSGGTPVTAHGNLSGVTPNNHHPHEHGLTTIDADGTQAHTDIDYTTPPEVGTSLVWTNADTAKPWELLNLYVTAGYGGIHQSAPIGLADIGAGWTTLEANVDAITTPRGVTQTPANNTIAFLTAGIWSISVSFSLTHNESNGSRTMVVRLWDEDAGVPSREVFIGVGRNTDTTAFGTTVLYEVQDAQVGHSIRVEVSGGGDTFTTVVENSFSITANLISEFRG